MKDNYYVVLTQNYRDEKNFRRFSTHKEAINFADSIMVNTDCDQIAIAKIYLQKEYVSTAKLVEVIGWE